MSGVKRKYQRRGTRECDHDWETRKRQVQPGRSQAHPAGAAPPEYEPVRICKKCHAERGGGRDE